MFGILVNQALTPQRRILEHTASRWALLFLTVLRATDGDFSDVIRCDGKREPESHLTQGSLPSYPYLQISRFPSKYKIVIADPPQPFGLMTGSCHLDCLSDYRAILGEGESGHQLGGFRWLFPASVALALLPPSSTSASAEGHSSPVWIQKQPASCFPELLQYRTQLTVTFSKTSFYPEIKEGRPNAGVIQQHLEGVALSRTQGFRVVCVRLSF